MNDLERLALEQAIIKVVGEDVSTKNPDSLRSRVDDALRDEFAKDGTDRRRLMLNGKGVGTLSARLTKEQPAGVRLVVDDRAALEHWALQNGCAREVVEIDDDALDACVADGVVPDGCHYEQVPAQPAQWNGTTLRVDPRKVAEAMGPSLAPAVAGILMAPNE